MQTEEEIVEEKKKAKEVTCIDVEEEKTVLLETKITHPLSSQVEYQKEHNNTPSPPISDHIKPTVSPSPLVRRAHQRIPSSEIPGLSTPIHHASLSSPLTQRQFSLQQQLVVQQQQQHYQQQQHQSPYLLSPQLPHETKELTSHNRYHQRLSSTNEIDVPSDAEAYIIKKELIIKELGRVAELMIQYYEQTKKLGFWEKLSRNTLLTLSGLTMIGFYFNADKTPSEIKDIIYYISLAGNTIGFILMLLSNNWNLGEQQHNSNTTYRGLHNLHDYVSHQLVRNGLTTHQMDDLLSDMSSRLLLIRDSADLGTWKPLHI